MTERRSASASFPEARALLLGLFAEACRAVSPAAVMPPELPLAADGRTAVIAIGKAAAEMMRVAQARTNSPLEGLVVTRYGHLPAGGAEWPGIELIEAGHPVPDANSVRAAKRALALARELQAGDRLLVLLSGGASALAAAPAPGVTLAEKQQITRALLRSGAGIAEINCVRKHLSAIKGGRLALAAGAADVATWAISDVPGDDPALIGSGPTVGDATTLAEARAVLGRYAIPLPPGVAAALADPANETPCVGDPALPRTEMRIVATAATALAAAARMAEAGGLAATDLGAALQDEARLLGAQQAALVRTLAREQRRLILSGGEARVTVADADGRGGRNLEYLLGLAIGLDGAPGVCAIAADTDGIDGSSDAAGAMIFPDTLERARALGLDPADCLAANRSHDFFAAVGDLVVTGPTLTNVNDFRAVLLDIPADG